MVRPPMTDIKHSECNGDPSVGVLCSHLVSDDLLTDLGYPVKIVSKMVGGQIITRDGTSRGTAMMDAWRAGKVRICTKTARTRVPGHG